MCCVLFFWLIQKELFILITHKCILILILESPSVAERPKDLVSPSYQDDNTSHNVDDINFEISSDALQSTEGNVQSLEKVCFVCNKRIE